MLTREELKRTITRIFDKLRGYDKENEGRCGCEGVKSCSMCPFDGKDTFCLSEHSIDIILNAFECVEKWAKEHPIVTMRDKYKEVFGVDPKNHSGDYLCPSYLGFKDVNCESGSYCSQCKEKFWASEYKQPIRCAEPYVESDDKSQQAVVAVGEES